VTGGIAGTVVITYSTGCGADDTHSVTVVAAPGALSGASTVCSGFGITLSDGAVGGTWTSTVTSVATVLATGVNTALVTGNIGGSATITYSTGCGAPVTKTITVLTQPGPVSGSTSLCFSSTTDLSDATPGGTWSSNNTTVATIGSGNGVVNSGIAGSVTMTYSTGCGTAVTTTLTVIPAPSTIAGAAFVCSGATTTLSDPISGGTWSSANTSIATVTTTGDVTGNLAGPVTITYSTGCGSDASKIVTVHNVPGPISGVSSLCAGLSATLSDGEAYGTWSSDNTTVATINSVTRVIVAGAAGTANITYSTGCGTDATLAFTTDAQPLTPAPITGTRVICNGSPTVLNNTVGGGVWNSNNTSVATVDAFGNVSCFTADTVSIYYTISNSCGIRAVSLQLTIQDPLSPPASITGGTTVCEGSILVLSDATSGGVWSSDNILVAAVNSGDVLGTSGGAATISYTISNICGSQSTMLTVSVNPLPAPGAIIGGTAAFCAGTSIFLSDAASGGTWSSNNTGVATIDNSGMVTGVSGGRSTIYYSVTNSCGTVPTSLIVTVDALPVIGAITGNLTICLGAITALSDTTSGGTWSFSPSGIATISATGVVTSITPGNATITYSVTNSCGTNATHSALTINTVPAPGPITGVVIVCPGHTTTLSDDLPGGIWSSDYPTVANINNIGVVFGMTAGTDTIRYSVTNSCGNTIVRTPLLVLPASAAACGPASVNTTVATKPELSVYPNPNDGIFTIRMASPDTEPAHIIITNVVGQVVKEFTTATSTDQDIRLEHINGMYIITAVTSHGSNVVKMIIKN
jgi:hypothetical protein